MKAIIRESYELLKNRLGRVPYLIDFYKEGEVDPLLIIREYKRIQHEYDLDDAETIPDELIQDGSFESALSWNERKSLIEAAVVSFRNHHNWLLPDYDQLRTWLFGEKNNLGH